jgi:hypothetical protein
MGATRCAWLQGAPAAAWAGRCRHICTCVLILNNAHEPGGECTQRPGARQFDARTASWNGGLGEKIFVHSPPGAEHLAVGNKRVLQLRRALYGLKQASSAWSKRLEGELRVEGFGQSDADPALWVLRREVGVVLIVFCGRWFGGSKNCGRGRCSGGSDWVHL